MSTKHRLARWVVVLTPMLVVACGDREIGAAPAPNTAATQALELTSSGQQANRNDEPNNNGPGLRRTSTESLKLPVPRAFDLSHVEPRYFAVALGKDPSRIFEFVRDQIAFEAYSGCLRGPRGTLMAMAGNTVDRAALLASLLVSSGQRVRYAHGKLSESTAQDLVSSMWAERVSGRSADAEDRSPEQKAEVEKLMIAIKRDGTLLAESLKKAGHPDRSEPAVTRDALIKETQDHYWVEWWQNGAWVAMDPSFATAAPGQVYTKAEETFDVLPEGIFHRVELRVRIEEYTGDKPAYREVLNYAAKAADLSGVDVFLNHEAAQSNGGSQVRPVLIAQLEQVIGLPFWLKVPHGNPAGGLVDALGGGGGGDDSIPTATAEFVGLEFIAPDGRKEKVIREIFDRVGKKRRIDGVTLSTESVAAGDGGSSNPENLAGAVYDFFVTTGAIHAEHLRGITNGPPQSEDEDANVGDHLRMISIAFTAISDGLLGRVADTTGRILRIYTDTPRVYVAELSAWDGTPRLNLDLRRDQPRVVVSGFRRDQLFVAEVLHGVVNGTLERLVIGFFADGKPAQESPPAPVMSTSLVFERAQAEKIPTVLLAHNSAALAASVPEDARARIDESLATGRVIVAPDRPVAVAGAPRFAWWQVDPHSGATIAVTDEGLHSSTAEGTVIRTERGVTLEVRIGNTTIDYVEAQDAQQAAGFVRNLTSNWGQKGIEIQWQGLVELWSTLL
jgi:hypothetical protein